MWVRIVAALLGVLNAANGVYMVIAPRTWFAGAASATGPFNAHFVTDIGFAFLAAGCGLTNTTWHISTTRSNRDGETTRLRRAVQ